MIYWKPVKLCHLSQPPLKTSLSPPCDPPGTCLQRPARHSEAPNEQSSAIRCTSSSEPCFKQLQAAKRFLLKVFVKKIVLSLKQNQKTTKTPAKKHRSPREKQTKTMSLFHPILKLLHLPSLLAVHLALWEWLFCGQRIALKGALYLRGLCSWTKTFVVGLEDSRRKKTFKK